MTKLPNILQKLIPVTLLVALSGGQSVHGAKLTVVAGGGGGTNRVAATNAQLQSPFGVDFDPAGNMYIVEMTGGRLLRVDRKGLLAVVAGTGEKGGAGDGGPALQAQLNGPHNLAVAPNGDIFLADTWNNRVRKIEANTGLISTVAGTGQKGFSGDGGLATDAQFGAIYCASLDPKAEQLYLADLDNRRIRAVNLKTGLVRTVAGNGRKGVPEDGTDALQAPLVDPRAVAVDGKKNIYILERSGHALRVVDSDGKIRTLAGRGQAGSSGDGGQARQALLNGPKHLCLDLEGNVIIADTENHVIRKYLPREGKIVRVAGSGIKGKGIGGSPAQAELNQPHGVFVHPSGALYIADSSNRRVLKIEE